MTSPSRPHRPARARTTLARMAVNATLAGAWAACLLALLPFLLNANVALKLANYVPLALPLVLFYAPASGLAWALLAGVVRLFAAFRVRVPWLGFRPFWRFWVADLALLAVIYWVNLRYTRDYLPASMSLHLLGTTVLLVIVSLVLVADSLWRGLRRRRPRRTLAVVVALLLTATLFGIRERYRPAESPPSASEFQPLRPSSSVLMLGLEGASLQDFMPMVAEDRLPHLARLFRQGSSAPLSSPRPARSAAAWATIRSGREPAEHGVVSDLHLMPPSGRPVFLLPPAGLLMEVPAALGLLRLEPLSGLGMKVIPMPEILDRCGYQVVDVGWSGRTPSTTPPGRGGERLPVVLRTHLERLRGHLEVARDAADGTPLATVLAQALAADLATGRSVLAAMSSEETMEPQALLVRFTGLDRVSRAFLRYQRPERFGNVSDDELERFGSVLPDYYRFMDAWLGLLLQAAGADTRAIVVSPYGMEPVGIATRVRNALSGQWHETGTNRRSEPGFLLASGPGVRIGGRLEKAQAEDVLPTMLYLLDLPVGRDMEGQPLPGFASDAFADENPVSVVPSWETVTVVPPSALW